MAGMRWMDYREINGYFVRKESTSIVTNRDGSKKACYMVYENKKMMIAGKPITFLWTMADVKEYCRN